MRLRFASVCVQPSTIVKTVSDEAVAALERRRAERMKELGDYRPYKGWLTDNADKAELLPEQQLMLLQQQAE